MKLYSTLASALLIVVTSISAHGQLYWDTNGATSGAGSGDGTWDGSNTNWSANEPGTSPTTWAADSLAVFSAGSDASGSYTVTVSGTQAASGLTLEDGFPTLSGGQIDLSGSGIVNVPSLSGFATINSVIGGSVGLAATGQGVLRLGGANVYTGATTVATATEGTVVRLLASGVIPDSSVLTLARGNANTIFELNGNDETVKSIATTGTTGSPPIALGSNTLTLADPQGETYAGLFTSSFGGRVIKNGSGNLILTGASGGFADGEFILNSGNIAIGAVNNFGTNANNSKLTINGGSLSNNAPAIGRSMSTKNIDIGGSFAFDFTGAANVEFVGGSGAALASPIITLKTANPTITVTSTGVGATGVLLLRGAIGDEGAGRGFTKAGNGTLVLQHNANTFSGNVTISEGSLRVVHQTATNTTGVPAGILDPTTSAVGNGAGTVFLSGGTLVYSGASQAPNPRLMPVLNPIVVTQDSTISYETTGNQGTDDVTFTFDDSLTGSGGTLTISRSTSNAATTNVFRPTFTGTFNFARPVVINQEADNKSTVLTSANTSGTQTWSGAISGNASLRRTGAGGSTVLSGANTYSGGTTVDAGTLTVSGSSATLGTGNVTVSGGTASISSGVANAIANTATVSLLTGGMMNLGAGINDVIALLSLDGNQFTSGTYGHTSSGAANVGLANPNDYFLGTGILTISAVIAGQPGDYNDDGFVDAADYVYWRKLYPDPTGPALPNDDSAGVNIDDYDRWVSNYGEGGPGGGGSGAVPEPASMGLVIVAVLGAAALRRRNR